LTVVFRDPCDALGLPKFAELLVERKISNETFEEWNRETGATPP